MATSRTLEEIFFNVSLYSKFEKYSMVSREWNKHLNTSLPKAEALPMSKKTLINFLEVADLQQP